MPFTAINSSDLTDITVPCILDVFEINSQPGNDVQSNSSYKQQWMLEISLVREQQSACETDDVLSPSRHLWWLNCVILTMVDAVLSDVTEHCWDPSGLS
jgi:hypothetical protein